IDYLILSYSLYERGIVPPDPAVAFLAHLIEDFADEWLTKAMFGWRWLAEVDQVQMSRWLAFDRMHGGGIDASQSAADKFRARQVGRMALVGCTKENFPLIEASTHVVLQSLEAHVTESFFLYGSRPSLAEFGLFGQLSQLATDPTPQSMMREHFPYTYRWLAHLDDLSGHSGEWADKPSAAALRIAQVAGAVYAPFLVANEAALDAGHDMLRFEALGHEFSQPVFKYQAKCLADLRTRYKALSDAGRDRVAGWTGDGWRIALDT
ncbi:MAG: glutathione S-transferase, partial [Sphingomonadaceae bacterium]